jgi:Na+-transporting NADH:ubiquinone oxidoreductase subunit NqrB
MDAILRHLRDPRLLQIASLTAILIYGVGWRGLDVEPGFIPVILATVLVTQWVGSRWSRLARFDARSALISGLSLCLLMRGQHVGWAVLAAMLAIGSKFSLRLKGKHIFNPTNFAIVFLLIATDAVWVSPGQWGSAPWVALLMGGAGTMVVTRAARADVTLAFLGAFGAVLFGRALWLGQPWATPLHQLQNGALVLFSFFMITDPKTTPDSRAGRILFAALVAAGAGSVAFLLYRPNGLLWSLAACSLLVPVIDRLLPGPRYAWGGTASAKPEPIQAAPTEAPVPVYLVIRRFTARVNRNPSGAVTIPR